MRADRASVFDHDASILVDCLSNQIRFRIQSAKSSSDSDPVSSLAFLQSSSGKSIHQHFRSSPPFQTASAQIGMVLELSPESSLFVVRCSLSISPLTLDSTQGSMLLLPSAPMNDGLRIGEVAKRAGVSIDTLRYYEKVRLLPRASRSAGGFRLFALEHVERVRFIRQAQQLGFSLNEIRGLLASGGADECMKVRDLLRSKLAEMDQRLKSIRAFRRVLAQHLSAC